ncbi:MAG: DUF1015 domain-containing protein [Candidatus Adiutrix sp.]
MVDIKPFKGVLYNLDEIKSNGSFLLAPPYDVLNNEERQGYLNFHPHNILHIDYGQQYETDKDKYDWHQRSGQILDEWLEKGVLEHLNEPAIFHMETEYKNPMTAEKTKRHGFVCVMRLEEFSQKGQIRPHEKTFSSHKNERLGLMKHTKANLSQVFGFFPDESREVISLMAKTVEGKSPDINIKDQRGLSHKVWINKDAQLNNQLCDHLKNKKVYIADGHHRYETALNYRRFIIEGDGSLPHENINYLMVYLCPMSDPGLVILPTHRLLNKTSKTSAEIIEALKPYFKISAKTFASHESQARDKFWQKMKKQKNSIGLYLGGEKAYYILKLLDSAKEENSLTEEAPELSSLDTVILSNLIFMEALGLTEKNLDDPDIISYVSDFDKAIKMVDSQKASAAFLLNPTTVEDILKVTEKNLVMPRKSTFFYPKVTTGLVINKL